MTYLAYNLLAALAAIVAVPYDLIRGLRRGRPWSSLAQRLGWLPHSFHQTASDSIWLHAVSVGEAASCEGLVRRLKERHPTLPVFVSTGTATGQALVRDKLSGVTAGVFYAPLDLPFANRRVLNTIRPRLVVIFETEIWPNLYWQVKQAGAGLMIVNGRLSDRAFPSYRCFRFLFQSVLRHVDLILAQSEEDCERMIAIGSDAARVEVGGNLKYDFQASDAVAPDAVRRFLAQCQPGPLIIAGSTREEEERPVVQAFQRVAERYVKALLIVAPRHPRRFEEAEAALVASGLPVVRRSALNSLSAGVELPAVLLLDSLGELSSLYALADVVFVGGSLNGWGGHNVLEPASSGRPVVVGPAMQNFAEIAETLLSERGMIRIGGQEELGASLLDLLRDRDAALAIGERGRRVAEAQQGATARAIDAGMRLYGDAVPVSIPSWPRRVLLGGPAMTWGAVTRRRAASFSAGNISSKRLKSFTLCVGNLSAGGEGKTPMVAWLVERLCERGYRTAVLTRGYRRDSREPRIIVGPESEHTAKQIGDEAYLLRRRFQDLEITVPMGVGADRFQVGTELEARFPIDVTVMDDGYQHFALERDFDLLVVDASRPFGGRRMLPLGRLREPISGASRARAILLTKTQPEVRYNGIESVLRRVNPGAPIFRAQTRAAAIVDAMSAAEKPLDSLLGERCVGFCGLGNPDSFWRTIEAMGIHPVERLAFPDHHRYSARDIDKIAEMARRAGAGVLLTTEKDFANLQSALDLPQESGPARVCAALGPLRLFCLRVEQDVEPGLLEFILSALPSSQNRPNQTWGPAAAASSRES